MQAGAGELRIALFKGVSQRPRRDAITDSNRTVPPGPFRKPGLRRKRRRHPRRAPMKRFRWQTIRKLRELLEETAPPPEQMAMRLRLMERDVILSVKGVFVYRRKARDGERVHGLYTRRIHLAEQSFALIEHDRTATLAPWRPAMDRALNQFVAGHVKGMSFDFKHGRGVEKEITKALGLDIGGRG